jgi:hypothetical protein
MRPTNPLKKNDNPYPDTFRATGFLSPFEFLLAPPITAQQSCSIGIVGKLIG